MSKTNGPRERLKRRRKKVINSERISNRDKRLILELSAGLDEDDMTNTSPVGTKAVSTNENYLTRLRKMAEAYEGNLGEITENELKRLLSDFDRGTHSDAKDGGYATGTMAQFQSAAKAFIKHHSLEIDPDDIPVSAPPSGSQAVDERDMFDKSDIEAMRDVIENPRDECLFELLLNTGQRIRAIQTLRIKDIDVQEVCIV